MRKNTIITLATFGILYSIISCRKYSDEILQLSSINIVHATNGALAVKVNYQGGSILYKTYNDSINYGANKVYSVVANGSPLSIVSTSDTTTFLIKGKYVFSAGSTYSLYLAGQYPAAVDTVLAKDTINNYNDSLIGVRFINLSPNAGNVNVYLSGNLTPEFANINYKQSSAFLAYGAKSNVTSLVFQVKDPATNTVLTSYTLSSTSTPKLAASRFHNITIVLRGLKNGSGTTALGTFGVANF